MIDLTGVRHHPAVEEVVEVLCSKTDNPDRAFFRIEVAYFLGKMASSMRAVIVTKNMAEMLVNIYAVDLASSGYGKGFSMNVMENDFIAGFRKQFLFETMPVIAEQNLWALASEKAIRDNTDPQAEFDKIQKVYFQTGAYLFTFDDGTVPAVKQLRTKLIRASIGALNFQVDEIGSNLERSMDMLNLYLELYDQGLAKSKLIKNSNENARVEDLEGKTPANMLLFGTPSKLFDGSKTEDMFYSLLDTGYARRCLFGYGQKDVIRQEQLTQEQIEALYLKSVDPQNDAAVTKWSNHFEGLANPARFNWRMNVEQDVGIKLLTYKHWCEYRARDLRESQTIQKAELEHRHTKALKLAGAYAFVDGSNEIEMDHLLSAILLVEESGQSFIQILHRDSAYVRLGKHIADIGVPVTQHTLAEALPFYKKVSAGAKNEMMSMATSWGYTNNVIIKKTFVDGIEFFHGEKLKETDLSQVRVSYSENWTYDFQTELVPFDQLHLLTQAEGIHWANHGFKGGHRSDVNTIPGFNLLVLDVDGAVSLDLAHELLKETMFMTYTTKRHQTAEGDWKDRFRLIIPINYELELDKDDYRQLVNDVMAWLPFQTAGDLAKVDETSNQRSKKWMAHAGGSYHYNLTGTVFDILPFIPKTRKNEEYQTSFQKVQSLDNLERWFAQRMGAEGSGRNNQMIKFALALVDANHDLDTVIRQVIAFDAKLSHPIGEDELRRTVLVTAEKRIRARQEQQAQAA